MKTNVKCSIKTITFEERNYSFKWFWRSPVKRGHLYNEKRKWVDCTITAITHVKISIITERITAARKNTPERWSKIKVSWGVNISFALMMRINMRLWMKWMSEWHNGIHHNRNDKSRISVHEYTITGAFFRKKLDREKILCKVDCWCSNTEQS